MQKFNLLKFIDELIAGYSQLKSIPLCVGKKVKSACGKKKRSRRWE
jgi:hypothetical protein